MMRRSHLGLLAALVRLAFLAAVVCPCPRPSAAADSGRAHDCCAPEAGVAAATTSCCAPDDGALRVSTPVPAATSLTAPTAAVAGLPHPVLAVLVASPVAVRAPLILRI